VSTSSHKPGKDGREEALSRYTLLTHLLDQAFRVPGTSWRFGLDALLGLIPGAGDVFTALIGMYGIVIARQLGAPASVQGRMLLNLAVDAVIGAIPILGDAFDFAFKAHVRNRVLLEQWLGRPTAARRSSILTLFAVLLGLLVIIIATVWLGIAGLRWLYTSLQGVAG
jgi:hypothetical protein